MVLRQFRNGIYTPIRGLSPRWGQWYLGPTPQPSPAMPKSAEFAAVFQDLRAILAEYEPKLKVVHDKPDNYYLDTFTIGTNKKPIMFGGVRINKNYVSYYLMAVYAQTGLLDGMSPALRKQMQGKACFNFKTRDPALFQELKAITKSGYRAWKKMEWVE
jgi:hypothetical protein